MMSDVRPASPFLRLPLEILDEILEELDLHCDLLSLALCSHACARLVIPRHSEYRVIRVRNSHHEMWAHLALTANLARNVREVHLCERDNYSSRDRVPKTLVPQLRPASENQASSQDESLRIKNICTALGHMRHLRTFTWSCNTLPTETAEHEADVIRVLAAKTTLEKFALTGPFASRAPGIHNDRTSVGYPVSIVKDHHFVENLIKSYCDSYGAHRI